MQIRRAIAIGDSYTEGFGDTRLDGGVRGWADLVIPELANQQGHPVEYANLAVRGKRLQSIVTEQLDLAISMQPDIISINGGGNDLMRLYIPTSHVAAALIAAAQRIRDAGIVPVIMSDPNPHAMPLPQGYVRKRGNQMLRPVAAWARENGVRFVDNWNDPRLISASMWVDDRVHLNSAGHGVLAANVMTAIGRTPDPDWAALEGSAEAEGRITWRYIREHAAPWLYRRLTGTSRGDSVIPKYGDYVTVPPGIDIEK